MWPALEYCSIDRFDDGAFPVICSTRLPFFDVHADEDGIAFHTATAQRFLEKILGGSYLAELGGVFLGVGVIQSIIQAFIKMFYLLV